MNYLHRLLLVASAAIFIVSSALAQNGTVTNHAFAIGKGAGVTGYGSALCTSAQIAVGQASADPLCKTITGDWTLSAAGAATLATVNANVGSFGSATQCPAVTVNAKGLVTAASATTCTPAVGSVTGFGTGVATFLATPSSANLRAALTDEVGTGAAYFVGGALGTPASGTLTNATGLPLSGLNTQAANTIVANATGSAASPTAVDISTLTAKASPASTDLVLISDQAASGSLKKVTVSSLASAGSVSSIAGNTGAFTLSHGLTNSTNDIQLSLNNATLQASPSNPTATTNTTGLMMGLGVTCHITPTYSGRVKLEFLGYGNNNTAAQGWTVRVYYGTGTAPANAAAITGTQLGTELRTDTATSSGGFNTTFANGGIITGLTPGTAYWFDIALKAPGSGTATILNVSCNAFEF